MSGLLDRVKAFLPAIKQANLELEEKQAREGAQSVVIDGSIYEIDGRSEEKEDEGSEVEEVEEEEGKEKDKREVCLEFALGNFDDTPIALLEAKLEEEDKKSKEEEDEALEENTEDEGDK